MYTIKHVELMMIQPKYFDEECENLCLDPVDKNYVFTRDDLDRHMDFTMLQTIAANQRNEIDKDTLYWIYNKLETYLYASDMMSASRLVSKVNDEILNNILRLNVWDFRCIRC